MGRRGPKAREFKPGQTVANWTVVREAPPDYNNNRYWWCRCACGKERAVRHHVLTLGDTRYCNACKPGRPMTNPDVVAGQKVGWWTILREVPRGETKRRAFVCQCKCGNVRAIPMTHLNRGNSLSCGCGRLYFLTCKAYELYGHVIGKVENGKLHFGAEGANGLEGPAHSGEQSTHSTP